MYVIAGDSWACGQWEVVSWGNTRLTDLGLTQHMIDSGRPVINIAEPGASNHAIYLRLRDHLRQNPHLQSHKVILFQTDMSRDPLFYRHNWECGFHQARDSTHTAFYQNLQSLVDEHAVKILLIGGVGETWSTEQINSQYPGLTVACQSLTNLIIDDDPFVEQPVLSIWDVGTDLSVSIMKSNSGSQELQDLLDEIDRGHSRVDRWVGHKQWFFPDGMHPNRGAHEKLFQYLVNESYI